MSRRTSRTRRTRRLLAAAPLLLAACRAAAPAAQPAGAPIGGDTTAVARLRADVAYLASDALGGRGTGTPGNDSAAAHIARRFAALRLAAPPGGHLQRFDALSAADAHAGRTEVRRTQNVVALLPGTDPVLAGEWVVVGAHFDHLGREGANAMDPQAGDAIRNGADDNASGTAAVLELARRFADRPARRPLAFVLFSGEELGLLGAEHFVANAPFDVARAQAMLNFDMVGRLRNDRLIVYGTGTAAELPAVLAAANVAPPLDVSPVPDGFGPSDHSAFHGRGVPVLHFFTDLHDDYHRATDDAALVNHEGMARVVDFAERVARRVADGPRLTPIRTAPRATAAAASPGDMAYFGSVPDMGAAAAPGLRLTGVTPGSPADLAGAQAGDVVVEFGGVPVTDLYTYTDALRSRKPGDRVTLVVVRGTERLTLTATLGRRP